jgi:hypothetical protein
MTEPLDIHRMVRSPNLPNRNMPLPCDYSADSCPIARTREIVDERWRLLILRDAFHSVRRFTDFHTDLKDPKAVLTQRFRSSSKKGCSALRLRTAAATRERLGPQWTTTVAGIERSGPVLR